MQQYENHVKPAYDSYIAPTMQHADIIVPRGGENEVDASTASPLKMLTNVDCSFCSHCSFTPRLEVVPNQAIKSGGDQPDCATCANSTHQQRIQAPVKTCRGEQKRI